MKMTKLNTKLGLVAALVALPFAASAEPRVYAYTTAENFCPSGQQPVSINGMICCGVPNQSISYQTAMRHGGGVKRSTSMTKTSTPGAICPEGEKGCFTN